MEKPVHPYAYVAEMALRWACIGRGLLNRDKRIRDLTIKKSGLLNKKLCKSQILA